VSETASDPPIQEGRQRWLTPGTAGIGGPSLLADVGHEIPTSLLPSLPTSTLGAPASTLGFIEGVSDALAGAAKLGGGALADDPHRRRRVAIGGYSATAILSSLIGVSNAVWQVAILRAGAWTARGLRVPARNALLADIVPADVYGRAYGFERTMDNLGAVVGPLAGIALVGIRGAILLSVIPGDGGPGDPLRDPPNPTARTAPAPADPHQHPCHPARQAAAADAGHRRL
jgi:MFS family permease